MLGLTGKHSPHYLIYWIIVERFLSPLSQLLERGLFEPEQGEGQMWGQRNSKYAAAIGTQLSLGARGNISSGSIVSSL
jgi:hypothetical protein